MVYKFQDNNFFQLYHTTKLIMEPKYTNHSAVNRINHPWNFLAVIVSQVVAASQKKKDVGPQPQQEVACINWSSLLMTLRSWQEPVKAIQTNVSVWITTPIPHPTPIHLLWECQKPDACFLSQQNPLISALQSSLSFSRFLSSLTEEWGPDGRRGKDLMFGSPLQAEPGRRHFSYSSL